MSNFPRGQIQIFQDHYRIHTGDDFGQFYSTDCLETAKNLSKELNPCLWIDNNNSAGA